MRRTKATLIYRRTKNLRAVQLLLGHGKIESTVRYLGVEVDDVLEDVTGPAGVAWTPDEGNTWFTLSGATGYWAVAFASPEAGWLVGTSGRILKISFSEQ